MLDPNNLQYSLIKISEKTTDNPSRRNTFSNLERRQPMDGLAALNAANLQAQTALPLIESATNVQSTRQLKTPTSISIDPVTISPEAAGLQDSHK